MGREVRMVPAGWQHPRDERGHHKPLFDGAGYSEDVADFLKLANTQGLQDALDYYGPAPDKEDYMLVDVPEEKRTHYMMYENTSEGTPISPAFATPEELARWLADNKASIFGGDTADYDTWMRVIKGSSPMLVFTPGEGLRTELIGGETHATDSRGE